MHDKDKYNNKDKHNDKATQSGKRKTFVLTCWPLFKLKGYVPARDLCQLLSLCPYLCRNMYKSDDMMFILWETCLPLTRSELQCHWQWWPGCPPIWPGWTMLILYQSILIRRNKARRTIIRQFCTNVKIKQERPTQAKPDATVQSWQAGHPPGAEGGGVCVPEYFLSLIFYCSTTIHNIHILRSV